MNVIIYILAYSLLILGIVGCTTQDVNGIRNDLLNSKKAPKFCRYRNWDLYPDTYWRHLTGNACYNYTDPNRLIKHPKILWQTIPNTNLTLFVTKINNTLTTFDYKNEIHIELIRSIFVNENYFKKYVDCCKAAEECCEEVMDDENIYSNENYPCPVVWDAWSCFPQTKKNEIAYKSCPTYILSTDDVICTLYSEKKCFENGTWEIQTNYNTCVTTPVYKRRYEFQLIALYISTALTIPSVIIFLIFPRLRITRVQLHLTLIVTIILKNILTILSKNIVVLDSLKSKSESLGILNNNGVPCRILAFFENFSKNAIFTSMLVDAFYLHKLIVRVFSNDINVYVLLAIGGVCSIIPSLIWATLMAAYDKEHCWMIDADSWFQWITDGYKYLILILNCILLFDILRVLIFKLRKNNQKEHTKSTLKATLFLIPIFGVPLLITGQRELFDSSNCTSSDVYYFSTYTIEGLQGVLVAILFCYMNAEVQEEIKNAARKFNIRIRERLGVNDNRRQFGRRSTAFTSVGNTFSGNCARTSLKADIKSEDKNKVTNWIENTNSEEINVNKLS